jgi:hypothetical protein
MKPPRFAVWMFGQLGARAGDELVDLYPGSGAITEAWRRCTGALRVTGDVGDVDARRVASSGMCAPAKRRYDVAVVGHEQALVCPVNGARCESVACIDVGCTGEDADFDAERAAARGGRARLLHRAGDRAAGVG